MVKNDTHSNVSSDTYSGASYVCQFPHQDYDK